MPRPKPLSKKLIALERKRQAKVMEQMQGTLRLAPLLSSEHQMPMTAKAFDDIIAREELRLKQLKDVRKGWPKQVLS